MSTVPGFPSGSPVAATDLLWVTRGSGVDRDKKATVTEVLEGGMLGLVDGGAYKASYIPVILPGASTTIRLPLNAFIPEAVALGKRTTNIPVWKNADGTVQVPQVGAEPMNSAPLPPSE